MTFFPVASTEDVATVLGSNCKFDGDIECNCCKLDVDRKRPDGGSACSAISMARCKRAFLLQSSIEYSSNANLYWDKSQTININNQLVVLRV